MQISDPQEILFVGDTLYTDILFAEESEFKRLLVLSGNTKKDAIQKYCITADYTLRE